MKALRPWAGRQCATCLCITPMPCPSPDKWLSHVTSSAHHAFHVKFWSHRELWQQQEEAAPAKPTVIRPDSAVSMEPPDGDAVDITSKTLPKGHYDPKNDVILHMECMRAKDVRVSSPSRWECLLSEHSAVCPSGWHAGYGKGLKTPV